MNAPTDLFYKYICLWPKFDVNKVALQPFCHAYGVTFSLAQGQQGVVVLIDYCLISGRDKLKSSHNEQSNTIKYKQSILKAN